MEEIYNKLVDVLNERHPQLLSESCEEFYVLARELFTPGQAEIACSMSLEPITIEGLKARIPRVESGYLRNELEEMADRGLVLIREKNAEKYYELLPLAPGSIELQFIAGQADQRAKRLLQLLNNYLMAPMKETKLSTSDSASGGRRVIPLNKLVIDYLTVLPYEEVVKLIDTKQYIAVGVCMCRHTNELMGRPCDKPKNNMCMVLGESAQLLDKRGYVHLISKDEARHIVEKADKAGLVHQYTNHGETGVDFLCNCCGCHCMALKGIIHSSSPSISAKANWVITIKEDACTGCGMCIDRCWTNALRIEGDIVVSDQNRCIGCGICRDACPSDAMQLVNRDIHASQC